MGAGEREPASLGMPYRVHVGDKFVLPDDISAAIHSTAMHRTMVIVKKGGYLVLKVEVIGQEQVCTIVGGPSDDQWRIITAVGDKPTPIGSAIAPSSRRSPLGGPGYLT